MNDELFDELMESVREGGAILRGEKSPARSFSIENPDIQGIRANRLPSKKENKRKSKTRSPRSFKVRRRGGK